MRIELLGTSFTVKTDEDEEYLREVIAHFAAKVAEVQGSVSTSDPLKTAILAGVLVSDELIKLTGSTRGESMEASRIAEALIGELTEVLEDDASSTDAPAEPEIDTMAPEI
jgi:cell division protein ZapA (FtsZ GTPase activity inhibitor)